VTTKTILIVDDDPTQRRLMRAVCEKAGYPVLQSDSGEAALQLLQGEQGNDVSLVMLDLRMPGLGGMETLKRAKSYRDELPVIVLTAQGGIDTVVEAMQSGAADFFVKPASPERVIVSINNALNISTLKGEVSRLKRKRDGAMAFGDLIGASAALKNVQRLGERAAASNIPILISGESGVGKEMIARAIQGSSDRSGRPFITVNCGAIPANLVESILFGHEKGSFTGAHQKHIGKFQEADSGTIFLDEVGELPADMQVKLLRVLQESEVDAIGSKRPTKVDVRVISATNRDLAEEVKAGRFREDLFYRLNVFPVHIPPLRERVEDIPALVDHFIQRYNAEERRASPGPAISASLRTRSSAPSSSPKRLTSPRATFRSLRRSSKPPASIWARRCSTTSARLRRTRRRRRARSPGIPRRRSRMSTSSTATDTCARLRRSNATLSSSRSTPMTGACRKSRAVSAWAARRSTGNSASTGLR
jgi:DNA-binding NtrC family response regulator